VALRIDIGIMSRNDPNERNRLVSVILDEASISRGAADQEHERQIAITILSTKIVALPGRDAGLMGQNRLQDAKLV